MGFYFFGLIMMKLTLAFALLWGILATGQAYAHNSNAQSSINTQLKSIEHFPQTLSKECRDGLAKLHDECGDQVAIIKNAIEAAKQQNKNVLLIYGGEWCIWCHVLDRYFNGKIQTHDYVWRDSNGDLSEWIMNETVSQDDIDNAILLNHYMADNFVIAHIDGDYANGNDALAYVGYHHKIYFYPTIMALDKQGQFAAMMPPATTIDGLSFRELNGQAYRGYDRKILLQEIQKLHQAANF